MRARAAQDRERSRGGSWHQIAPGVSLHRVADRGCRELGPVELGSLLSAAKEGRITTKARQGLDYDRSAPERAPSRCPSRTRTRNRPRPHNLLIEDDYHRRHARLLRRIVPWRARVEASLTARSDPFWALPAASARLQGIHFRPIPPSSSGSKKSSMSRTSPQVLQIFLSPEISRSAVSFTSSIISWGRLSWSASWASLDTHLA